jgi:hypothetical protein
VAVETRPRGAGALLATPPRAVAMTILAGAAISLQSYLNGRLGREVGSATVAAAVNNLVATLATLGIVLLTGALPRAVGRVRAVGRQPAGRRGRNRTGRGSVRSAATGWPG